MNLLPLDKKGEQLVNLLVEAFFNNGKDITEVTSALALVIPDAYQNYTQSKYRLTLTNSLRRDVGQAIKSLIEDDTTESLAIALDLVQGLRNVVDQYSRSLGQEFLEKLHNLIEDSAFFSPHDLLKLQGRVHGTEGYKKLRLSPGENIPKIPNEIIEQCLNAPVTSMIILDMGYSLAQLEVTTRDLRHRVELANFNDYFYTQEKHADPRWVIVPMEICKEPNTLGLSKDDALKAVQKSSRDKTIQIVAPELRELVTGILLHSLDTQELLLADEYTYTSKPDVVVSSLAVYHIGLSDGGFIDDVGLAPCAIK